MPHHNDEPQVFGLTCVEPGDPAPVLAKRLEEVGTATVMPLGAYSTANAFVRPTTPPFDAT